MFGWLTNTLSPDPATLDHLPVNVTNEPTAEQKATAPGEGLTHSEKLRLAAERAGKPFRCATDGLPREVKTGLCGSETRVVGTKPALVPEPPPKVTSIRTAR